MSEVSKEFSLSSDLFPLTSVFNSVRLNALSTSGRQPWSGASGLTAVSGDSYDRLSKRELTMR